MCGYIAASPEASIPYKIRFAMDGSSKASVFHPLLINNMSKMFLKWLVGIISSCILQACSTYTVATFFNYFP
jgi:hypothetical protein